VIGRPQDLAADVAKVLADGTPRTAPELALVVGRRRDVVDELLAGDRRFLRVSPPSGRSALAHTWGLAPEGVGRVPTRGDELSLGVADHADGEEAA
jgi:hypothetical protein